MKVKYEVFKEKDYGETYGRGGYEKVGNFRGEKEAMEFISDFNNYRRYGEMLLEKRDSDGRRYFWDAASKSWCPYSKEREKEREHE